MIMYQPKYHLIMTNILKFPKIDQRSPSQIQYVNLQDDFLCILMKRKKPRLWNDTKLVMIQTQKFSSFRFVSQEDILQM